MLNSLLKSPIDIIVKVYCLQFISHLPEEIVNLQQVCTAVEIDLA